MGLPGAQAQLRLSMDPAGTVAVPAQSGPEGTAPSGPPVLPTYRPMAPLAPTPEAGRFHVGAGDQLTINVYGHPEMGAEVTVNDNGQITLPLIGMLKVAGSAPGQVEQQIARRLREGDYLKKPEVSVQVKQLKSQMVSLLGEVQRPGRYPLQGRFTVLEALATAGGTTPKADRVVLVLRRDSTDSGRREIAVRLDQLTGTQGGAGLDLELKNDDVVFVGPQKVFYVYGEVRRPGAYPMEADLNLMRVLAISGGVSERGSANRVMVHRKNAAGVLESLELKPESPILSGDVVFVKERLF